MSTVQVMDATYQYLYDAQGRRRLKKYPVNDAQDEYFYEGDHLIEDVGMTSLVDWPDERHMLNQYVWLAGLPVAVLKTTTDKDVVPVASPKLCQRNDEAEPCGTYFIVNDSLPKPVALIDSEGRLAGSGDYDVFGRVNEVTVSQDTPAAAGTPPQPFGAYLPSQNLVLAYLKQPATSSSLAVQLRVRYAAINTGSAGDFTWVEDGTTGAALTPAYKGWVLGEKTTPWLPVGAGGLVHVRWQSDGVGENSTYSGVTVGSYEYRRYEVGASPWWLPVRFPGQYADAESGLFENWNRFYDPSTGRYSASDPLLRTPVARSRAPFGYARQNPLALIDSTGLVEGSSSNAGAGGSGDIYNQARCRNGEAAFCYHWSEQVESVELYGGLDAVDGMAAGALDAILDLSEGRGDVEWASAVVQAEPDRLGYVHPETSGSDEEVAIAVQPGTLVAGVHTHTDSPPRPGPVDARAMREAPVYIYGAQSGLFVKWTSTGTAAMGGMTPSISSWTQKRAPAVNLFVGASAKPILRIRSKPYGGL